MNVEIDQSGKVEKTHRATALGLASASGKLAVSVLISAAAKKQLQREFRTAGRPRAFISRVFAAAVVLLLRQAKGWTNVIIDTEYPGHEAVITRYILEFAPKASVVIASDQIHFHQIGKKSRAHAVAHQAFTTKRADIQLSASHIRSLLL